MGVIIQYIKNKKPRRFSKYFINSEIKKLNKYRTIVRKYL